MSAPLRVGIIGCGRPGGSDGATGTGIAHSHAKGYAEVPETQLVALADVVLANAEAFQAIHGGDALYTDFEEMLAKEKLDMVSICTWPGLHAPMVEAAAKAGVRAILCEKPMAPTWAAAKSMKATADAHGVVLALNHQRRFDPPYMKAKELLANELGGLKRLEMQCDNLFDWGTHWFDMMHFLNHETPAEWIMSQIEPTGGPSFFGVTMEGQAITQVGFANGVKAVLITGKEPGWGAMIRAWGANGLLEIGAIGWDSLRWWVSGQPEWIVEDFSDVKTSGFARAIADIVLALEDGHEPELSVNRALRGTELMFAAYESGRKGGRVSIPVAFEDSGLYYA
ncbi:MAG: Gfo/Idh/MocA family protein [Fimbriimonas sp.]